MIPRDFTLTPLLLGVMLVALVPAASAADELPAPQFAPSRLITYKKIGDVELKLHVFNPPGFAPGDRRPAIVFFFGGGWQNGSPAKLYPQCAYLASRGMVAIAPEYRTEELHHTTPQECVKDGKSAMRWVRAHAAELGIDPHRLAAGGGSAGGHVAAAMATVDGFNEDTDDLSVSCRPDALVLFCPVIDEGPTGYAFDRVGAYWRGFSPLHNIDGGEPPTVIFLGTKDHLIPVATVVDYQKRMDSFGERCDLHIYSGQRHGFFNLSRSVEYFNLTMNATDAFLGSLGFLEGPPAIQIGKLELWETFSTAAGDASGELPDGWWLEGAAAGATARLDHGHLLVDSTAAGGSGATVWLDRAIPRDADVIFKVQVEASIKDANAMNVCFQFHDPDGRALKETRAERADGHYQHYHSERLEGTIITYVADGHPDQARLRVRQVPPFEPVLAEYNGYHARAGQAYWMRIVREGQRLIVEVDGHRLADVTLPARASDEAGGYLGFRTWHTKVWWDDLVLRIPPKLKPD